MTYVYPDFYPEFRCIASKCRHSCCRGWEIDIDDDTMELYEGISGDIGEEIRRNIERHPSPHFVLTENEDCPFLRDDGLCRLMLELGEEGLCDICTEHPRFYNEYPDRTEVGLGLCCEEAVRLLLGKNKPLKLLTENGEDEPCETPELLLRSRIYAVLAETEHPLSERMDKALRLVGAEPLDYGTRELASFYLTLERLDGRWTQLLESLRRSENMPLPKPEGVSYERIAEYFIYRHFAAAETAVRGQILRFAFLSVRLLRALEARCDAPLSELVRLYSAEIEYSDENIGKILEFLT